MRRARTTTPLPLSARSGVSKKYTCRICASSGSIPSAAIAERCADSGTVTFSSTLSESLISASMRPSSSSVSLAVGVLVEAMRSSFCD